jgi:hypothetical protein
MLLQSRMLQNRTKNDPDPLPIEVTVICEGSTLSCQNEAYSSLLEKLFKERNIKLIKNAQCSIDTEHKLISLPTTK